MPALKTQPAYEKLNTVSEDLSRPEDSDSSPFNHNKTTHTLVFSVFTLALVGNVCSAFFQFSNTSEGFAEMRLAQESSLNVLFSFILVSGDFLANILSISPRNNANEFMLQNSTGHSRAITLWNIVVVASSISSVYLASSLTSVVGILSLLKIKYENSVNYYSTMLVLSLFFGIIGSGYYYCFDFRARHETSKALIAELSLTQHDLDAWRTMQTVLQCLCVMTYRALVAGGSILSFINLWSISPRSWVKYALVMWVIAGTALNVAATRLFKIDQAWRKADFTTLSASQKNDARKNLTNKDIFCEFLNTKKTPLAFFMTAGIALIIGAYVTSTASKALLVLCLIPLAINFFAQRDLIINNAALKPYRAINSTPKKTENLVLSNENNPLKKEHENVEKENGLDQMLDPEAGMSTEKSLSQPLLEKSSSSKEKQNAFKELAKTFKEDRDIQNSAKFFSICGRAARLVGFLRFAKTLTNLFGIELPFLANIGVGLFFAVPNSINQYSQYRDNMIAILSQKRAEAYVYGLSKKNSNDSKSPKIWLRSDIASLMLHLYTVGMIEYTVNDLNNGKQARQKELNLSQSLFKKNESLTPKTEDTQYTDNKRVDFIK